ncbi:MAG: dihydropteroate synthase, partial [Actinomycetota bacterium]
MGILNVTPDSFADGGKHYAISDALNRAKEMIDEGVDIIDIGGESTKPGAERVTEDEEAARVLPVLEQVIPLGVEVSIDTTRSAIAAK